MRNRLLALTVVVLTLIGFAKIGRPLADKVTKALKDRGKAIDDNINKTK